MRQICGDGVPADNNWAFVLLTTAQHMGHTEAAYNLGICYHYGFGTKVDLEKAYTLYLESAESGYGTQMGLIPLLWLIEYGWQNNKMMIYVENQLYGRNEK